jgi:hypothetical protein
MSANRQIHTACQDAQCCRPLGFVFAIARVCNCNCKQQSAVLRCVIQKVKYRAAVSSGKSLKDKEPMACIAYVE